MAPNSRSATASWPSGPLDDPVVARLMTIPGID
jgi:hypothetical protein